MITGLSYLTNDTCGAVRRHLRMPCESPREACHLLEGHGLQKAPPKNFGRFDRVSLRAHAVVLWACVDAGISFTESKRRIGVVGSSFEGSLESNQAFFQDYVSAGRKSARSNLFVYTLPTTPLAEAALYCGFTGPVCHVFQSSGGVGRLLEEAGLLAAREDVEAMFAVCSDPEGAACFVVQKSDEQSAWSLDVVSARIGNLTTVCQIVEILDRA